MQQQTNSTHQEQQFKRIGNFVYSLDWKLGAGNFATVYRAIDPNTKQVYALKVIKFQSLTSKLTAVLLEQQIGILQILNHPYIIKCHEVINSSNNCYMVMDFCKFGDLGTLLKMKKKFTQDQISSYVYQLYQGFLYLVRNKILHRDFKPANIFVDGQGNCRIADFGFAIKAQTTPFKDVSLGSPFYMAPQIIYQREYSMKTDVWAFGVTIYELIYGHPPLQGCRSPEQLKVKVLQPIPYNNISSALRIFLQKCLQIRPKDRISFQQMQKEPYIRKIVEQQCKSKKSSSESVSQGNRSCTKSSHLLFKSILKKPISYDEAASLLQYCRFLQRVIQSITGGQILQKWLLVMIKRLDRAQIKSNQISNIKQFKEIIKGYSQHYKKQFKNMEKKLKAQDVLSQCKKLIQTNKKAKSLIMMLGSQTHLLSEAFVHPLKLVYYAKTSNINEYFSKLSASRLK